MKHEILKAYKFRLYPNAEQKSKLNQTFGCVRVVWNKLVENFNAYGTDAYDSKLNEKKMKENPETPWLKDVAAVALQQKSMDFNEAKTQFFNKKRKKRIGRMQFKKRGNKQSYRLTNQASSFHDGYIKMSKIGKIKTVMHRAIPSDADFRQMTISKTPSGKFYVSILVKQKVSLKPLSGSNIGIDLGIKDLFVFSDGSKTDNPKWFHENQMKLKKAQRHLSRKQSGSNRYHKQRVKVARAHEDVANRRNDFLHKISTHLVEEYDVISIEDLNVAGMLKNRNLSKAIANASWSTFVSMLDYKCRWYGKSLVRIGRFFASTKTCHDCGQKTDLKLSDRDWTCSGCGSHHDRDINAAKNILSEGLNILTSAGTVDNKRGEDVRLGSFVNQANLDEALKKPNPFGVFG